MLGLEATSRPDSASAAADHMMNHCVMIGPRDCRPPLDQPPCDADDPVLVARGKDEYAAIVNFEAGKARLRPSCEESGA